MEFHKSRCFSQGREVTRKLTLRSLLEIRCGLLPPPFLTLFLLFSYSISDCVVHCCVASEHEVVQFLYLSARIAGTV